MLAELVSGALMHHALRPVLHACINHTKKWMLGFE
jgi:hypothetical protein